MDEGTAVSIRPVDHGLGDGRMLSYRGTRQRLIDGAVVRQHHYVGPDGLVAVAAIEATPNGRLLRVRVSYPGHAPSWRDLQEVSDAFFPPGRGVIARDPHPDGDRNGHKHCRHLWEVPGDRPDRYIPGHRSA
ncbi:MAG: hypothetical protein JOZ41_10540 [Chloroflexi bacterium]|nr:hypothetical protein [Chloroflexota bacterium]